MSMITNKIRCQKKKIPTRSVTSANYLSGILHADSKKNPNGGGKQLSQGLESVHCVRLDCTGHLGG